MNWLDRVWLVYIFLTAGYGALCAARHKHLRAGSWFHLANFSLLLMIVSLLLRIL